MTWKTTSAGNVISISAKRLNQRESFRQLSRFLVIGTTSVLIDLAVYTLLTTTALSPHLAKGISYVAGMIFGFLGNKFWTFGSRRKSASEPILYVVLYTVSLGVNVTINGMILAWTDHQWVMMAFLIATGVTTILNFLGMRWVTFREGVRERLSAEGVE